MLLYCHSKIVFENLVTVKFTDERPQKPMSEVVVKTLLQLEFVQIDEGDLYKPGKWYEIEIKES